MHETFKTLIEPFRIKAVEPLPLPNPAEREAGLREAAYNLLQLPADRVTIDLLTDSGTGAMSARQWAALHNADERASGSTSWNLLKSTVQRLTGLEHVLPVHQGSAAQRVVASTLLVPGQVVVSNRIAPSTLVAIERASCQGVSLPISQAFEGQSDYPFKGNMDLRGLDAALKEHGAKVGLVVLTLTNHTIHGQPVSMANIEGTASLCRARGVPLFIDATRFAENAWFIRERELRYRDRSPQEIALQMFEWCDGLTLSAKNDGMSNVGGVLCTRSRTWADRFESALAGDEGFPTYGGLPGRDMAAMSVGLEESLDVDFLRYRAESIAAFGNGLAHAGLPVVRPSGGHAVFIDAGVFLPQIPKEQFPGQALIVELYREGGVRGLEVGSLHHSGARRELVRLALPRRVYTQAHVDYVVEVAGRVAARRSQVQGYDRVGDASGVLPFKVRLRPHDSTRTLGPNGSRSPAMDSAPLR